MAKKKFFVKVMFPGFTHAGKIYSPGEVEENPDNFLIQLAKSGEQRFHADSSREIRIARMVRAETEILSDDDYEDEESIVRTPVYVDESEPEDGLRDKTKVELVILSQNLGFKKESAKATDRDKLIKLIRFLRFL